VLGVQTEFTKGFATVGGNDDGHFVGEPQVLDDPAEPAEFRVPVVDGAVVAVDEVFEVGSGTDLIGQLWGTRDLLGPPQ